LTDRPRRFEVSVFKNLRTVSSVAGSLFCQKIDEYDALRFAKKSWPYLIPAESVVLAYFRPS